MSRKWSKQMKTPYKSLPSLDFSAFLISFPNKLCSLAHSRRSPSGWSKCYLLYSYFICINWFRCRQSLPNRFSRRRYPCWNYMGATNHRRVLRRHPNRCQLASYIRWVGINLHRTSRRSPTFSRWNYPSSSWYLSSWKLMETLRFAIARLNNWCLQHTCPRPNVFHQKFGMFATQNHRSFINNELFT